MWIKRSALEQRGDENVRDHPAASIDRDQSRGSASRPVGERWYGSGKPSGGAKRTNCIVGYSPGAACAIKLARLLGDEEIPVETLVAIQSMGACASDRQREEGSGHLQL